MASGLKGNVPCKSKGDQPGAALVLFRVVGACKNQHSTHGNDRQGQAGMDVNILSPYSTRGREEWGGGGGLARRKWEGRNAENKK